MRPSPLPGFVPTGRNDFVAKPKSNVSITQAESNIKGAKIRPDFEKELAMRLEGWLGEEGSERFKNLEGTVRPYLKPSGSQGPRIDLSKLPESSKQDLEKLQHAAEGLEAIFVKKLLSQMRNVSFSKEKSGPMADFAKDLMDQTVAEQASKGRSTIGLARMVFLDTAQTLVRSALARPIEKE